MQGALPLLAAAGGQVYDAETGLWTGATPEMVQMLDTYATIYGDEGLGDTDLQLLQDGRDRSFEAFANGEVGMLIESDYFWRSVVNPDGGIFPMDDRDAAVGWAMIPAYEAGGALGGLDGASMSGGGLWTLNPNTEHPAEAWALITFMNSAEQIEARLAGSAQVTARDDVNAEVLANDPMLSYIAEEILPITHYRPSFAEYPQVSVALQEAVESVVTGTSAEDAAADYQSRVGRDRRRRRRQRWLTARSYQRLCRSRLAAGRAPAASCSVRAGRSASSPPPPPSSPSSSSSRRCGRCTSG